MYVPSKWKYCTEERRDARARFSTEDCCAPNPMYANEQIYVILLYYCSYRKVEGRNCERTATTRFSTRRTVAVDEFP